jgi:hypothetical protein
VVRLRTLGVALALALGACTPRHGGGPSPTPIAQGPPLGPGAAVDDDGPGAPPPPPSNGGGANGGPFFVADANRRAVPILRADAPNTRYAALDRDTCEAELTRRNVPYVRGEATEGVLAPVRLRGAVRGVSIHTDRVAKEREKSIYEIFDCRLLLALDDFSELIARRDVVEMIHFNAYRPKTQNGCTKKYWGLQHCAALAIDVRELKRKDGSVLNVERDFHGRIGLGTCANGVAPSPVTAQATELWSFVCEAAQRALFNVMLTPNYNAEHKNHFHLEVTPDAGWMMIK